MSLEQDAAREAAEIVHRSWRYLQAVQAGRGDRMGAVFAAAQALDAAQVVSIHSRPALELVRLGSHLLEQLDAGAGDLDEACVCVAFASDAVDLVMVDHGMPGLMGATPAASLTQLGLQAGASSTDLSFASSYVAAQLPPGTTDAAASILQAAGGWSNMSEQQQTQYAEGITDALAAAIVPGAGAVIMQVIFSAFGVAGSGPGCTCPNCPEPFSPLPTLSSVGGSGSFQTMCNKMGLAEWSTDASCSGYKVSGWAGPTSSYAAWVPIIAANATAWNKATDTSGPGMFDINGITGLSGSKYNNGILQVQGPTVPAGQMLIMRTVQAGGTTFGGQPVVGVGPLFPDMIGTAFDYLAQVANGYASADFNTAPSWNVVPQGTVVSMLVNNGNPIPVASAQAPASAKSSSSAGTVVLVGGALLGAAAAAWGLTGHSFTWSAVKAVLEHGGGGRKERT